jgi:hypothetical protein
MNPKKSINVEFGCSGEGEWKSWSCFWVMYWHLEMSLSKENRSISKHGVMPSVDVVLED